MKNGKKVLEKCERLGYLTLQKEKIEAEIGELRNHISATLKVGTNIAFEVTGYADVDDRSFTLIKRVEDKAVLITNQKISRIIGVANFIDVAKISKTEIEKQFGKAVIASCIDHFDSEEKLVLRKTF